MQFYTPPVVSPTQDAGPRSCERMHMNYGTPPTTGPNLKEDHGTQVELWVIPDYILPTPPDGWGACTYMLHVFPC